ncbi:DNA internalization-related competence protein ComEC/Rec2 [Massilia sp. CFBP9026]|uniref:DNA internalization-related competence protein ComEC/Rec2 n=1 Tax=Massilia sp. CFBP9026 TaxID=3096536 RepID=UPI002A6A4F52|nr:DNA internalization-related competence protein ComEC/Rec2 [Massilia sp. CFBP9026]MDY0964189.1 DNA internalization-related competence protein ComEC/Rec2 [Massilia sp. CFBP9026]
MRSAILAFATGAAGLQLQSTLPPASVMLACAATTIVACLLLRGLPRTITTGLLLGFCWAAFIAHLALSQALPHDDEGRDITVTGAIASLPHRFDGGVRFQFDVAHTETRNATVPPRIVLSWYGATAADPAFIHPGERWRLVVRLQRPHGNANPHGFDYEAWLLEQGVRATGYVRPAGSRNECLDDWTPGASYAIERARGYLRTRILTILEGEPYAGVIVALVIGDQRGIDQDDWDVFNRTGISHLVSISGLHITMVAGLAAWIVASLWRRSFWTDAQLPLRLPAQKAAALAGATVALMYVLLAGFGVPAQRTFYMLAVVAAAVWCGRIASSSHVLCLALGIVVLLDPWAMLWPGFWLSFGAVAAILYACSGRLGERTRGWRVGLLVGARTQWAVTIGLAPLTLLLFGQISLVSPLANAVAIPVISLFVTPLALVGSILPSPLAALVLGVAHLAIEWLAWPLQRLAAPALAVWTAPAPTPWILALALFGTAWMLAPRGWPQRWAGLAAWTPLLTQLPAAPPPGAFTVTAFDVGQGMALLVETGRHRLLYDTGPQYAPGASGATRVILPYLRGRGIGRLDTLVVSHSDLDHVGGANAVLETLEVGEVRSSLPSAHPLLRMAPRRQRCLAGQGWEWDGVRFEMLAPDAASYANPRLKANARSCVLRVSASGKAILLAGDIEAAQEAALLRTDAARLRADVLLAPHHGSGTSSTASFLQAVGPSLGIFQVGHRNRYRHPKGEVYERYAEHGIGRLRTDERGAVTLRFGSELQVETHRETHARYWHGR